MLETDLPRLMTIFSASTGNGRCRAFASSHGARIQALRSSSVVRITGIALEWTGSTTAFGAANCNRLIPRWQMEGASKPGRQTSMS